MTPEAGSATGRLGRRAAGPNLARWLLVATVGVQFLVLATAQIGPQFRRLWAVREDSALERSARLSYGADFADYVRFLRAVIPESALVVIPSPDAAPPLGEMPFMQYYLFPRRLTNCPVDVVWEECMAHYGGPQTYVIAAGGFPPAGDLTATKVYIPLDAERGVYAPREGNGG